MSSTAQESEKKKPRVVAIGNPKYVDVDYLADFQRRFDFSVIEAYDRQQTKEMLPDDIKKNGPIDAVVVRMGNLPYGKFDADLFSALSPGCRIIASASAGYDEFDVEWIAREGIWFSNTVDAVAEATADMAMFLILATLKNTTNAEKSARSGNWRAGGSLAPTRDPSGLTLGIVGLGAIGKYLASKATVFNLKVVYYNRNKLPDDIESQYNVTYCNSLHELLACADVVSINCPSNAGTEGLIGSPEFAAMKNGVYFINTARGLVVDEPSLIDALESGKVERAGLDVFPNEPDINPYFQTSDKVIIQPHLGGLTDNAFQRGETDCFENIRALFEKGKPRSPVIDLTKVTNGDR